MTWRQLLSGDRPVLSYVNPRRLRPPSPRPCRPLALTHAALYAVCALRTTFRQYLFFFRSQYCSVNNTRARDVIILSLSLLWTITTRIDETETTFFFFSSSLFFFHRHQHCVLYAGAHCANPSRSVHCCCRRSLPGTLCCCCCCCYVIYMYKPCRRICIAQRCGGGGRLKKKNNKTDFDLITRVGWGGGEGLYVVVR